MVKLAMTDVLLTSMPEWYGWFNCYLDPPVDAILVGVNIRSRSKSESMLSSPLIAYG
jgi:hypothetical protein